MARQDEVTRKKGDKGGANPARKRDQELGMGLGESRSKGGKTRDRSAPQRGGENTKRDRNG